MSLPSLYITRKRRTDEERTASEVRKSRQHYPGLSGVVDKIREFILHGRGKMDVRSKALEITKGIPVDQRTGHPDRRNFGNIAQAVYQWMKHNIAYVRDPHFIEWVQDAEATLKIRSGDCDDMTVLSGALLMSLGVPCRILIIGQKDNNPDQFSHIYLEFQHNGRWYPFDVTLASRAGSGIPDEHITKRWEVMLSDVNTTTTMDDASSESYHGKSGFLDDRTTHIASGTASGAAVGTAVLPGIGTAVGAVVGGVTGIFTGLTASRAPRRAQRDAAMSALRQMGANPRIYIHYNNHAAAVELVQYAQSNPFIIQALNEVMPWQGDWEIHVKSKPETLRRIYARAEELKQAQRPTGSLPVSMPAMLSTGANIPNPLLLGLGVLAAAGGTYLVLK